MELAPGKPLRVTVGQRRGPRSVVWRIWVEKQNDIYLAERDTAAMHKISLHPSGDWRVAMTTQHTERLGLPERAMHLRWRRPEEAVPGWTAGPWLTVLKRDFRVNRKTPPGGTVFVPSKPGFEQVTIKTWVVDLPDASFELTTDELIAALPMPNGQRFVVSVEHHNLTAGAQNAVDNLRADGLAAATERDIDPTGQRIVGVIKLPKVYCALADIAL